MLSNISRCMLPQTKNNGRDDKPFYAPLRDGGKRANAGSYRKLADVAKTMPKALRRRKLPGMGDEGWVPTQRIISSRGTLQLGTNVHDVYDIVSGKGDRNKLRVELSADRSVIRCAQGRERCPPRLSSRSAECAILGPWG